MRFKQKRYDECIEILNNKIIKLFENKIKNINPKFKYTNIIDLIDEAKKYLDTNDNLLLKEFYILKREECEVEFELYELMKIYDKLVVLKKIN